MQIGIQVSSLRPFLTDPYKVHSAFQNIAALGCRTVQLQWIDPSVPIPAIATALRDTGLVAVSVQDLYVDVMEKTDYYMELSQVTGATDLTVSRIPESFRSADGLKRYIDTLLRLEEQLSAVHQTLSFHPVLTDYARIENIDPMEQILQGCPKIRLCLDLCHLARSQHAMRPYLASHADRIPIVHFKDHIAGRLVPAGQGEIDWTGVVKACMDAHVQYAFVEQETFDREPYQCLLEALQWLQTETKSLASDEKS